MAMPNDPNSMNKIYLLLQSNGYIVLDKDHLWDGCDTPELPPSIEMPPVSIRKLVELLRDRNLEWPEKDETENLKVLLNELKESAGIIEDTIKTIEAKTKKPPRRSKAWRPFLFGSFWRL